jgi:hypothetical protein
VVIQCIQKVDVHLGYGTFRFRPGLMLVDITSNTCLKVHSDFLNADLQKVFANKIKGVQACINALPTSFISAQ